MDKRVILGGVIGGIVILAFGFSILLIVNSFFPTLVAGSNIWIGLVPMLLAPVAGGFLSGLIGKSNPLQAGPDCRSAGRFGGVHWLDCICRFTGGIDPERHCDRFPVGDPGPSHGWICPTTKKELKSFILKSNMNPTERE